MLIVDKICKCCIHQNLNGEYDKLKPKNGGEFTMNDKTCIPFNKTIEVTQLARAYVPMQKMCSLLEPKLALYYGTIFPELVSEYK